MLAERARDTLIVLSVELGPIIKLTTDYIKEMTGETNIMGKVFGTVFETIVISGANAAFVIKAIADEIMHTIENAKILWTGGIAAAIALNEAHSAKWEEERRRLDEFQSKIMNRNFGGSLPSQMSSWNDIAAKPAVKRPVKAGVDPEVEKRKAVIFKAMMDANIGHTVGYGDDIYTERATKKFYEFIIRSFSPQSKKKFYRQNFFNFLGSFKFMFSVFILNY